MAASPPLLTGLTFLVTGEFSVELGEKCTRICWWAEKNGKQPVSLTMVMLQMTTIDPSKQDDDR